MRHRCAHLHQGKRKVEEGKLDLKKYVSKVVRLENIEDGFAAIRDENALKILVEP